MVQGPGPRASEGDAAPPEGAPRGHEQGHAAHAEHVHADEPAAHDQHGFAEVAGEIGRRARRRRLRTGFLLALFTLAAITLVAELALRLTHQRERALEHNVTRTNRRWVALTRAHIFEELSDPERRYGMRAGAAAEIDGWHFRVSAQHTRGPDVPAVKPAHEKRLLCLGDSFAFGLWCDEQETLPFQLAARAEARERELGTDVHWRALDLGVPGYHLGQTLRAFETDGLALQPDVVVLYTNTNDLEQSGFFYDDELGILRRDFLPLPDGLKSTLWHWSYLYGWIAARHARAVEDGPTPYLEPRVPWAHVRADNQRYAHDCIARIAELCRAHGLPLFVVNQPLMTFLGDARHADWPVLPLDAFVRGVCTELHLPALHLLGWLRGYADGVDRFEQGVPPDFLPDVYIADERAQALVTYARAQAKAAGRDLDTLPYAEQLGYYAGFPDEIPTDLDFHLTGAAYAHIARLAYEKMRAEKILP